MSVTTLVKNSCSTLGEAPHWEEKTQRLVYVDIMAGDVHIYDPVTKKDEKKHFGKSSFMSRQIYGVKTSWKTMHVT